MARPSKQVECLTVNTPTATFTLACLKVTWSVRGFLFFIFIVLYGINYTDYSVKTVKICFHLPFRG